MNNDQIQVIKAALKQHVTNCSKIDFDNPDSRILLQQVKKLEYEMSDIYDITNGFNKANAILEGVKLY